MRISFATVEQRGTVETAIAGRADGETDRLVGC